MARDAQTAAVMQLQAKLLEAMGIDTKQATRVELVFDVGQLPKATVARVLIVDGQMVQRVESMVLKFEPVPKPDCAGPIAFHMLDQTEPRQVCGARELIAGGCSRHEACAVSLEGRALLKEIARQVSQSDLSASLSVVESAEAPRAPESQKG